MNAVLQQLIDSALATTRQKEISFSVVVGRDAELQEKDKRNKRNAEMATRIFIWLVGIIVAFYPLVYSIITYYMRKIKPVDESIIWRFWDNGDILWIGTSMLASSIVDTICDLNYRKIHQKPPKGLGSIIFIVFFAIIMFIQIMLYMDNINNPGILYIREFSFGAILLCVAASLISLICNKTKETL